MNVLCPENYEEFKEHYQNGTSCPWMDRLSSICPKVYNKWLKAAIAEVHGISYLYMVTFTIDPKKHPEVTDDLVNQIELYISSLTQRVALKIIYLSYVKELHKDGRPHWHVAIKTVKSLDKSRFCTYQKKFGNIDFSPSKTQSLDEMLNYMDKEGSRVELLV